MNSRLGAAAAEMKYGCTPGKYKNIAKCLIIVQMCQAMRQKQTVHKNGGIDK